MQRPFFPPRLGEVGVFCCVCSVYNIQMPIGLSQGYPEGLPWLRLCCCLLLLRVRVSASVCVKRARAPL
jgi:hypothetical protein